MNCEGSYYGTGASQYWSTFYQYDWRDRPTGVLGPDGVAAIDTLDNLGQVTESPTVARAEHGSASVPIDLSWAVPRAYTTSSYETHGQVYTTSAHDITGVSMVAGNGTVTV